MTRSAPPEEPRAVDRLAELQRSAATPVLSRFGLRREARNYSLRSADGDLLVVSFDNAGTDPKGSAAEIEAGCFPRYFLERLNPRRGNPARVPHASMAMFHWRIEAPPDASYAPDRGEPFATWWALGERTPQTARALAHELETTAVPRLLSLADAETQYALAEAEYPDLGYELHHGDKSWDRVLVRLGREPRPEIERLLDQIPTDDRFAEASAAFTRWVRQRLDTVYGQQRDNG
jgi:hypothetical protein